MDSPAIAHATGSRERWLLGLATLLGIALWFACRHFTVDDAYIAYRHAHNLARGDGPVMNPGERVEGVSNLPWTVALAAAARSGWAPHVAGPWLASICGLACVFGAFAAAGRSAAGGAALLTASGAPFVAWSASGMETSAYALALLALAIALATRRASAAGSALGVVASLRPEGAVFGLASGASIRGRGMPALRRFLVAAALVFGALVVFRLAYYGDWLPNPARAKSPQGWASIAPGIAYLGRFALAYPLVLFLTWRSGSAARWLVATQLVVIVLVGGDRFPGYRFAAAVWPLLAVAAAQGLAPPRRELGGAKGWGWAVGLALAGTVFTVAPRIVLPLAEALAGLERLQRPVASHAALLAGEIRHAGIVFLAVALWIASHRVRAARPGVALALVLACTLVPSGFDPALRACRAPDPSARLGQAVGTWLATHVPAGTLVATNAAGALPYFSGLPVVDMLGLTDRHIARRPAVSSAWIGHERGDGAYVLARQPAIIIFGGPEGSVEPWPFPGDREIAADPRFHAEYVLERVPLDGFEFVFYHRRDVDIARP